MPTDPDRDTFAIRGAYDDWLVITTPAEEADRGD